MVDVVGRARCFLRLAGLFAALAIAYQLVPALSAAPVAAAPAIDETGASFMSRLLDEINKRRDLIGTPRLASIPPSAGAALDGFFAQTEPGLAWPRPCIHQLLGGAFSWEYVVATGFEGEARGEVLACPGPEPYWTPALAAQQWWRSPAHFVVLYGDPYANAVACSALGLQSGVNEARRKGDVHLVDAAIAVICVTFHD
jgi:hypothetical protein